MENEDGGGEGDKVGLPHGKENRTTTINRESGNRTHRQDHGGRGGGKQPRTEHDVIDERRARARTRA